MHYCVTYKCYVTLTWICCCVTKGGPPFSIDFMPDLQSEVTSGFAIFQKAHDVFGTVDLERSQHGYLFGRPIPGIFFSLYRIFASCWRARQRYVFQENFHISAFLRSLKAIKRR